MKFSEQLLDAMGDVGVDLVDMAEKVRFPKSFLRRTMPVAACMALFLGAGLFLQHYLIEAPAASEMAAAPSEPEPTALYANEKYRTEQAEEVSDFAAELLASEAAPYYLVDIPGQTRRVAAVDEKGSILVEAENVEFIIDQITGDYLAILATTEYGADSDWVSTERIVYDLQGQELCRINARSVLVCGDLAAVTYSTNDVDLYLRDGTLVQDGFSSAWARKDCMVCCYGESLENRAYYRPDGTMLMNDTLEDDLRTFDSLGSGRGALLIRRENGLNGLVDLYGNWVVEPLFTEFRAAEHDYIRCKDAAGDWFLVNEHTGEIAYKMTSANEWVSGIYEGVLTVSTGGQFRVEDWYHNVIIPEVDQIEVIDDDGDHVPELLRAWEGSDAVYYEPDGTERLRITGAGALVTLSSDAAVYTRTIQEENTEEWVVDFAIIDLNTGLGNRDFEKAYLTAEEVCVYPQNGHVRKTGLFYAYYQAENGSDAIDLLDETGKVLLEDLQRSARTGEPHIGGGVFLTADGYRYADGRWLYRFAD